ncbi:MAG: recombinase family protein [Chloroflexi bacterium]|nr:recombinase family protein [Chloroflexota bacterium]
MIATSKPLVRIAEAIQGLQGERYAALYVRVSTGKQKDNWSVKDQRTLARLGEERGLPVVVYEEQGISGETIEDRPVMSRLLIDVKKGRVAVIICVATSRLSRDEDIIDTLQLQAACRENDTIVITPEQVYDNSTRTGTVFGQIKAIFDADQKQEIVKSVTRGQYAKFRAGGWVGSVVPFGYHAVADVPHQDGRPRSRLEIDPEEAAIVRLIFDLYANGRTNERGEWLPMSQRQVALYLNDQGYRMRVRPTHANRKGSRYQPGQERPIAPDDVQRITTSRIYIGIFERGKSHLSKWVRDEGMAEAHHPELQLVNVALWQRAQEVRKARASDARRIACTTHALSGLLRCPRCGGRMFIRVPKGREPAYKCGTYMQLGASHCLGAEVRERLARAAVESLLIDYLEKLHLRRYLDQEAADQAMQTEGEIAQTILVELQQAEDGIQRLVKAVASGVFTPEEARHEKLGLLVKKERLEARLKKLQKRANARDELLETVAYVEGNIPGLLRELDGARFRQLARLALDNVVVITERAEGRNWAGRIVSHQLTDTCRELLATFEAQVSASPTTTSSTNWLASSGATAERRTITAR